jgi:hypothetical protein
LSARIGRILAEMTKAVLQDELVSVPTNDVVLAQLEILIRDEVFRSSKRSVEFLKYVVHATLDGAADQIKERTIGAEVFGRSSSYDTNLDHVVRTAATELRKRLAIYYGDERHRSEVRISLVPGSYVPRFTFPPEPHALVEAVLHEHTYEVELPSPLPVRPRRSRRLRLRVLAAIVAVAVVCAIGYAWLRPVNSEYAFWKPLLDTPGPVLLAVGAVPNGPPTLPASSDSQDPSPPLLQPEASESVPFADAVTIARVVGVLQSNGKKTLIRRESSSTFSDLREGPVVLIGAFNNEWSLRLTKQLRYTLALDAEKHLIYIRDAKNPGSRVWSWATNQSRDLKGGPGTPVMHDYALISRIRNSETGHMVIVIGGLYVYGTESAGEFLTDPVLMQSIAKAAQGGSRYKNLQIVLETTVTDGTPGPPKVLVVSTD